MLHHKNPKKARKPHTPDSRQVVLIILDGFGISRKLNGNAPKKAKMPVFKGMLKTYPNSLLRADGEAVGLPPNEAGNSEAGHQTIGAGRAVLSDKVLINQEIKHKSFSKNPALLQAVEHVKKNQSTLHLMGLLTDRESAHASMEHVYALVDLLQKNKVKKAALHVFTDGRDTHPFHAIKLLADLEAKLPVEYKIATVSGRFYAMDRNRNWHRTKMVYDCLVHGKGLMAESASQAIEQAYEKNLSDEFIRPTVIKNHGRPQHIKNNDAVIFWNLRSDRARQLAKPFIGVKFDGLGKNGFKRGTKLSNLLFVTLTEFGKQLDHAVSAYPHHELDGTLVEALRSRRQMYIAESEKYAHVTYFFNGGYDNPRFGEERIRIPSHKALSFSRVPQMRAKEIGSEVVKSLLSGYDFICANFANPDMVAHTGDFQATVKACEFVDKALAKIQKTAIKRNAILIIIADHGNAEEVRISNGRTDTHHNANPVPFIVCGLKNNPKCHQGTLSDIAPTILKIMSEPVPEPMTGKCLFS